SGNLTESKGKIKVDLTTASRARVFLAEQRLWITLDAGQLQSLEYDPTTTQIRLSLASANDSYTENTLLNIENDRYKVLGYKKDGQGRYVIPGNIKTVTLTKRN
ncbi:hypothetical protein HP439_12325, partial [Sphingobacterium shayense]|uniref:DUF5695 domain-containing protein n=1 Tax=Sphingobacterium shayense TaxID=626343 RepID=UPI001FE3BE8A